MATSIRGLMFDDHRSPVRPPRPPRLRVRTIRSRRSPSFSFSLFALCFLLAPVTAHSQSVVGRAVDATTEAPVVSASVELLDVESEVRGRVLTDSTGAFRVMAPLPGMYRVRVSMLGYATVESDELAAEQGMQLEVEVRMAPQAVVLDPIRVVTRREYAVGRLAEYYERAEWTKRTGNGRVFTRDEIEQIRPINITQLFERVPRRQGCPMTYFLDGLPVERADLDALARPEDVEGVEIYRSRLQLPVEYAARAACGATMVWMRRDIPGRPLSWTRIGVAAGLLGVIWLLLGR